MERDPETGVRRLSRWGRQSSIIAGLEEQFDGPHFFDDFQDGRVIANVWVDGMEYNVEFVEVGRGPE